LLLANTPAITDIVTVAGVLFFFIIYTAAASFVHAIAGALTVTSVFAFVVVSAVVVTVVSGPAVADASGYIFWFNKWLKKY
jgi:hypothetical protein